MAYLKIEDIKKSFGQTEVLRGINIEVNKGEIVAILGGSGNGKTTLLRCLAGLETPDSGAIYLNDKLIFPKKKKDPICPPEMGFVFQNFNLFPQYTALKNVTLAMNIKNKNKKENIIKAETLLEKVGLGDKKDFYPYQLSGGQKQRLAIARALALEPELLLFDEPTSALDPKIIKSVTSLIKSLGQEYTIVIITHDINFASTVANRGFFIYNGVVELEGNMDYLLKSNNPLMNEFLGKDEE